jgi:Spy/CpxP family protein refolding chaperone
VRNTLDDQLAQRAAVRRQTLLRLAAARREMDAVLTPEQQQKLDDRFGRLRKLWGVAPEGNGP